ncbi:Gfo/Idh/MocA family oxidoreductase [Paenibacillus sp. WQ 127069]|uniref:Gfo/Idh/MocA family oxidoreductase n=1 Tax=Paenibacillus baimaensis TaxID=2982185 RepID=A0ABT2UGK1_9BACL|nr:Gfo/Idh/MocA family oxidoreductase [Paenibacillus sp. WQ 127069]MCU6793166.1 Gfo/Idh/MocA family oxidoreductase [Paenibacillus sp. WQ 127069]
MERAKVIQVGVGGFGKNWIEGIKDVKSIQIVAIVDVVQENLVEALKVLGDGNIPVYLSYEDAFREVKADLALLITPPPTRHRLTRAALDAGMHVIVEKPMASNYKEGLELLAISQQYDKAVSVNQNYRWTPEMKAIRNALESGMIGKLGVVEWQFDRDGSRHRGPQSEWRKDREEPLLTELSIHHFDLMRYLLNVHPESVFASSFSPIWNERIGHSSASAIIKFKGGIHVNYFASSANKGKDTTWTGNFRLVGSSGTLEFTEGTAYYVTEAGERQQLELPELEYEGVAYTVNEFVLAVTEGRKPVTHITDNLISFSMVGAAVESSKTGHVVRLDTGHYQAY